MLSLTGRLGLHAHDFQFNSEEVQGINWRGEIESVHVGKKIHYEPNDQRHSRLQMPCRMLYRMLTGNKCCKYGKAIQKQEVKEKRREKAECVRAKRTDLREKNKKTERVHLKSLNIKDKVG